MNSGPLLFLGLFVTMACSWLSFVLGPQLQLGDLTRGKTVITGGAEGSDYPNPKPGLARQGAEIYRANGCADCHTRQVRPRGMGTDISRGWGIRRSTGLDYLFDRPILLGSVRAGPDLANAGRRMDANAVLLHLYEPRTIIRGSIMPPFPFLFDTHKITGLPSPEALQIPPPYSPPQGYEVVPLPAARELAAYVVSLHQDDYLFEAPPPPLKKKAAPKAVAAPPKK